MYNKRLATDYFINTHKEIKELEFFERELKIDFIPNKIIAIIGPRRAGKTFFLKIIGKKLFENPFYIDFEDIIFKNLEPTEVFDLISLYSEIFGKTPDVLLLDEIQNLKDWNSVARSLLDRNFKILMSGSSSKLLSKEIATQLGGRTISYILLPASFKEFLIFKNFPFERYLNLENEANIKRFLKEYLIYGGYPEVILSENEERKKRILSEYYTTVFYKDFVERFKLKSLDLAKFIFDFFLQNYSSLFSIRKFINFLSSQGIKFGKSTVYNYIEKLPETLTIFFVEKFSASIYERKSWPKKVYICDLGLANILKFSEEVGKRMENIVFLNLQRKINENPLLNIYFFKKNQYEVDFVIKEGANIKQLIQVTYALSKDEIDKREIKSLVKASEELNCKDLLIITWDYENELKLENKVIRFIPLWKWLLE